MSEINPIPSDLSLIIRHRWERHLGRKGETSTYDRAVAKGLRDVEAAAGDLSLSASRTVSDSTVKGEHLDGGITTNYVEILTIAGGAVAALAALIAKISPLITALASKSAAASVRMKSGDVEIELKGTADVTKALTALRDLEQGKRPTLIVPGSGKHTT
jgi:hypothetical protein